MTLKINLEIIQKKYRKILLCIYIDLFLQNDIEIIMDDINQFQKARQMMIVLRILCIV